VAHDTQAAPPDRQETLPTLERFRSKNKCVEVDASQDRQAVYNVVRANLAEYTDESLADKPLTQKAEMLLGIRPWPKKD